MTWRIVEWQYEQKKNNFKTFDIFTSYDLEEAFNLQKTSLTIKIDNIEYYANVVHKLATKGKKQIQLKRTDLKGKAQQKYIKYIRQLFLFFNFCVF